MLYFDSDYMAGGHPHVMDLLNETNMLHTTGYGTDEFTKRAEELIKNECGYPDGKVFFLTGGTQTNLVVIDRLLSRNDGVIAAESAHINVHEAGAIEASGHKVISLPADNGKLSANAIRKYVKDFYDDETYPHMVRPAMVYLSFPTELGTIYTLKELEEIAEVCKEFDMYFYIDGARLAFGLAASAGDVTIKDLARLTDAFYIGGTKCGALFGEAVMTRRPELFNRFNSLIKLHGAMLAKGRLLGVQFEALFADGLYYRIGKEAVRLAIKLKEGFTKKGYKLYIDSPTNQQFFILPNEVIKNLRDNGISFELWGPLLEKETPVRFVTGWATTDKDIDKLLEVIS